jgi:hypothetical protein
VKVLAAGAFGQVMVASVNPKKTGDNLPPYLVAKVMKIEDKEGLLEQVEEAMITERMAALCPGFKAGCKGLSVHKDEAGLYLVALYRRALMDSDRLFAALRRHPRFPEIVVGCSLAYGQCYVVQQTVKITFLRQNTPTMDPCFGPSAVARATVYSTSMRAKSVVIIRVCYLLLLPTSISNCMAYTKCCASFKSASQDVLSQLLQGSSYVLCSCTLQHGCSISS